MNPPRHERAIAAAREALRGLKGVRSAVLFGSAARGTAMEDSDIDLFVECTKGAEGRVRHLLYDLASQFDVTISPIFYRPGKYEGTDEQFLESVLRNGRVLRGALPRLTPRELDLQPLRLVSYETRGLDPRRRARLLRALDGYRTRKRVGRRRYEVERAGLLERLGGWRVGRGAIVVPEEAAEALDALLQRYGAKRLMVPIWSQRP